MGARNLSPNFGDSQRYRHCYEHAGKLFMLANVAADIALEFLCAPQILPK
jgi:hypothetical protein